MSEWPTVTLHDAGIRLLDCDHKTPKAQEIGLPYIGIPQLKDGRIKLDGARLISEEDFTHWRRKAKPMPEDVILSRRCNPGETAYVPEGLDIALGQNLVLLRADGDRVYPPFLRWVVKTPNWWHQIDKYINVGAIFDSLRCADIPKFEIKLPPLETQIQIDSVLKSLDEKIALNRQTNQTLEQIAQAIFKSWFVDFEPVKAKQHIRALGGNDEQIGRAAQAVIAGAVNLDVITTATDLSALDRQLTQALNEKLAHQTAEQREQLATTAGHFPDQLMESELGLIPEGWEVSTIEALFELNPKRTLKKGQLAPYLEMKNMPTQGHLASEWTDREMGSGTRFMNGDALMARITPCLENGKTAFVDFLDDGVIGWGSTEYIVIRSKEPLPLAMAYLLARDKEFRSFAIQNMTGTSGRQRVNAKSLVDYRVVHSNVPGLYAQFGLQLEKIMAAIKINGDESRYLSRLRDLLLPKLLSGELTINGTPNKPERRTT